MPPNGAAALRWIVEIKGEERPDDAKKAVAAQRWVRAVNRDGRHGLWEYRYLRNPADLARALSERTGFATPVALS